MIFIRIIENLLILYYGFTFAVEFYLFLLFVVVWRKENKYRRQNVQEYPGISILVPAHNESVTIVACVKSLLALDYPHFEIILVNDGSTDDTLGSLKKAFRLDFNEAYSYADNLGTLPPKAIYCLAEDPRLIIVDKQKGGKADALNVGLNISQYEYCCSVDADSVLDSGALKSIIVPFLADNGQSIALVGGALAVANDSRFRGNEIEVGGIPRSSWVRFQAIEYLRSFWINRIGLSRYGLLLILSGAFTLFKRNIVIKAGGFYSPYNHHPYLSSIVSTGKGTVCEDIEVVVRIRRYLRENNLPDKTLFMPWPICWTEVPEKLASLAKQRNRWHRGLLETLWIHRKILFDPRYGVLGMMAAPYYLIFEAISPLIRFFTYFFIVFLIWTGRIHSLFTLLLMLFVIITGALALGMATVAIESWAQRHSSIHIKALRYRSIGDWLKLIWAAFLLDIIFGALRNIWQLAGTYDFLRGVKSWGKSVRVGFKE